MQIIPLSMLAALSLQALTTGESINIDLNDETHVAFAMSKFTGKDVTRIAYLGDNKLRISTASGPIYDGGMEFGKVHQIGDDIIITAQVGIKDKDLSTEAGRNLYEILDAIRVKSPEFALDAIVDIELDFCAFRLSKRTGFQLEPMDLMDEGQIIDVQISADREFVTLLTDNATWKFTIDATKQALSANGVWWQDDKKPSFWSSGFTQDPHALLRDNASDTWTQTVFTKKGVAVPYKDGQALIEADEQIVIADKHHVKIVVMPSINDDGSIVGWTGVYSGKVNDEQVWGTRSNQAVTEFIDPDTKYYGIYADSSKRPQLEQTETV